jgi:hypothetical protein
MSAKDKLASELDKYIREKHTQDECMGFIDGFEAALKVEKANKADGLRFNLILTVICFGILLFQFIINSSIITHPYMVTMIIVLSLVGGINFGSVLYKLFKFS